jgi:hypothetical protein
MNFDLSTLTFDNPLIPILLVLVAMFILGAWVFPYYRIKNAVPAVVEIFQQYGSTSEKTAKWPHEMGLGVPTMTRRLFRTRDYKPQALEVLIRAAVLAVCDDGKIFLVTQNLLTSNLNIDNKYGDAGNSSDKPAKTPRF